MKAPPSLLLVVVLACLAVCPGVHAQEASVDRKGAAEAYDKGTAAYLAREYAQAAGWFETAHRLSPAPAALQQAIRAYRRAQDLQRAATLALELARDYPDNATARRLAEEVLLEGRSQLVQVEVSCEACSLALDGKVQAGQSFFVAPNSSHEVTASFANGDARRAFEAGEAGSQLDLPIDAPAAAFSPGEGEGVTPGDKLAVTSQASSDGAPLPPYVTYVAAGVTGALAIATVISGVGANVRGSSYDEAAGDWQAADCATMASPSETCQRLYDRARSRLDSAEGSELRTNLLLAGTLVAGAATVAIAVFFTDWDEDDDPKVALSGSPDGDLFARVKVTF